MKRTTLIQRIKHIKSGDFVALALAVFRYQATNNPLYAQYLDLLGVRQVDVQRLTDIPFLPIQFYKNYNIQTGQWQPEITFTSSGTTGAQTSHHHCRDKALYRQNARQIFESFYGPLSDFTIFALLPSYLERQGSSLIFMAEDFIKTSGDSASGFYLDEQEQLLDKLSLAQERNAKQSLDKRRKILLLGVTFALLDLAEAHACDLSEVIIMETGGMKGRRKELTRTEVHQQLSTAFGTVKIHSEYGMTELFSQAYSKGQGIFYPGGTMRVLTREITDPFHIYEHGRAGGLNIIDLANVDTISFIATDDLGKIYSDGSFEILGRLDASDVRGCNLLVI